MGFNNGFERSKYDKEQERLRVEYDQLRMSEDAKRSIRDFDNEVFRHNRTYAEHNVPLSETEYEDESAYSSLHHAHGDVFNASGFEESMDHSDWLDGIENEALYQALSELADDDRELLKLVLLDGYTQKEVAEKKSLSASRVSRRIKKILGILKKVQF